MDARTTEMPFAPLPATFLDDLDRCGAGRVVEIGCGDGAVTALLAGLGCEPVTVDRVGPPMARPMVIGDALSLPFRRVRMLLVANLLRHLWPRLPVVGPATWADLIEPGGCIWIFEDEPVTEPAGAANYGRLQALLARFDPAGRGQLLSQLEFKRARCGWNWGGRWLDGQARNRWPAQAEEVIGMLAPSTGPANGPVAELVADLRRDGLDYGRFWWSRWGREATT